jgi:hypothetical protein
MVDLPRTVRQDKAVRSPVGHAGLEGGLAKRSVHQIHVTLHGACLKQSSGACSVATLSTRARPPARTAPDEILNEAEVRRLFEATKGLRERFEARVQAPKIMR